jgi:hypothetical protein
MARKPGTPKTVETLTHVIPITHRDATNRFGRFREGSADDTEDTASEP